MYKVVVLSALVAVCVAQVPQDTPEVAQAKAEHFAAFADAQARSLGAPVFPAPNPVFAPAPVFPPAPVFTPNPVSPPWKVWDGVPAPIVVANGQVQDIAEVAAEKSKHFALVADAAIRSAATGPQDDGKYRTDASGEYIPFVQSPVMPTQFFPSTFVHNLPVNVPYPYSQTPVIVSHGYIQDTPEVAALKAARLAELRAAGAAI